MTLQIHLLLVNDNTYGTEQIHNINAAWLNISVLTLIPFYFRIFFYAQRNGNIHIFLLMFYSSFCFLHLSLKGWNPRRRYYQLPKYACKIEMFVIRNEHLCVTKLMGMTTASQAKFNGHLWPELSITILAKSLQIPGVYNEVPHIFYDIAYKSTSGCYITYTSGCKRQIW